MNVRFCSVFKRSLSEEVKRYSEITPSLGREFHPRVKEATQTVIQRRCGDHVGPHGFPCRHTRPFPYLVYYEIEGDDLYFLGLVFAGRHPDFLKRLLGVQA